MLNEWSCIIDVDLYFTRGLRAIWFGSKWVLSLKLGGAVF